MSENEESTATTKTETSANSANANQTVVPPAKGKRGFGSLSDEWIAALIIAILIILGIAGSLTKSVLLLAIVVGCVGGLIHDLIQNKAIVLRPKTTDEGIYIGWILGIILGGAAGFIAIASGAVSTAFDAQNLLAPFTAGIALKGITDAATNAKVSDVKEKKPLP